MNYISKILIKLLKSRLILLRQALTLNRVRAVFLCLILITSFSLTSFVPWYTARALAAPKKSNSLNVENQKGKEKPEGIKGKSLDPKQELHGPGINEPKKNGFEQKELVDKRERYKEVIQNTDGSLTEKNYISSKFYQKNGKWETINSTLVEDTNAANSQGIGKLLGFIGSAFKGVTSYKVAANDWQAKLSSSNDSVGMARIELGKDTLIYSPIDAKDVDPVLTTDSQGKQTVHYYDIWPGVNLDYIVNSESLKLNIELKDKNATNNIAFKVSGGTLTPDKDNPGAFKVDGSLGGKFNVTPINLILNKHGLVTEPGVYHQEYKDGVLRTWVNKDFLQHLSAESFPAVIDPTTSPAQFSGTRAGGNYMSFKSDGYVCNSSICNIYSGSLLDSSNIWRAWRGAFSVPYSFLAGQDLVYANLHLTQLTNTTFWTGNYAAHQFAAFWAPCLDSFNCISAPTSPGFSGVSTSGDINVTEIYRQKVALGDYGAWLMMVGEECGCDTYKNFDPEGTYVSFTYSPKAPMTSPVLPADNQTIVTDQPTLQINPVSSVSGDQIKYYYRLSTSPDAETGAIINSGDVTDTQWTIPEGVLQDGTTYYWHAYTSNWVNGQLYSYTSPNWVRSFKVNLRTGKDNTQSYDSAGPVSVGLATGNVSTSASSHSMRALGGNIGIGLDYNSPKKTKPGLVGSYYNNNNLSGSPALTRVDQNVNFDWGTASPSSNVVVSDNFSAQWNGYFVAPATDTYTFGGINDDYNTIRITINGVEQVAYNGTCYSTVTCYGTQTFALNAGDIVPIKIDYVEISGPAYVRNYIKGLITPAQIIPNEWLRTPLKDSNPTNGLKSFYFNDNGSHTAPADKSTAFSSRTEIGSQFNWSTGSAVASGPTDNWMSTYEGYVTAPTDGVYTFKTIADDAARVTVDGQVIINDYAPDGAVSSTSSPGVSLIGGKSVPIKIEYYELGGAANLYFTVKSATLAEQDVPANWLSSQVKVLPDGWNLNLDADGALAYDYARVTPSSVILSDAAGTSSEFKWDAAKGSYTSPVNDHSLLVRNNDGSITLNATSGMVYVFNVDGTLREVSTPANAKNPTALKYTYSGIPPRLTQITDPIDPSRNGTLYYSGDTNCTAPPTGFDPTAPSNMLCAFKTTDGDATFFYYKKGLLSRIELPGGNITDIGYDSLGRITQQKSSLANDAIVAGVILDDANATSEISYDILGRASKITEPAPNPTALRRQHTYTYLSKNESQWSDPQEFKGSVPQSNVSLVNWGEDKVVALSRNSANAPLARFYQNGVWEPDWQVLDGGILDEPTGASMNNDRIDIFARGLDSTMFTKTYQAGAWGAWSQIPSGGVSNAPMSATSWGPGRIDLEIRGVNNALFHATYLNGIFYPWANLGGVLSNGPSVSSWGPDRLNIFVTDMGVPSKIVTKNWASGWENFTALSNEPVSSAVSSASLPNKEIHLVVRNTSNQLRYMRYDGAVWQDWETLAPCIQGTPSITSAGSDTMVVAYKGCDGKLYEIRRTPIKGSTTVKISNTSEPVGYTQKIDFDNTYRTIRAYDKAGNIGTTGWHSIKDYTLSSTDPLGLKTTTIYDQNDLPIENYGPAPKEWFDASRRPLAAYSTQVPKTESKYDEAITGLNVAWFDAKSDTLYGAPKLFTTNIEPGTNRIAYDNQKPITATAVGSTGIGLRGSGKITFPGTGAYTFNGNVNTASDIYRLYIDGKLVVNKPINSTAVNQTGVFNAVAGKQYDFTIEFIDTASDGYMSTFVQGPGLPVQASYVEFANLIKPGYNLNTSNKAFDSVTGDVSSSINYGTTPELGLMQSTTSDVGGLSYTSSATYEAQGVANSLLRQTSKSLPGGNTTTYTYYGATEAVDNPCTTAIDAVSQAGFGKITTEQDPDGAGVAVSRTKEFVYDKKGRVVAARMNKDPWTCTSYDARGRKTQVVQPTINSRVGRTVSYSYNILGNPLKSSTTDSLVGTTESGIDLLGRGISGKDIWGNIYTTSYDANGRAASIVSPVGTETYTYDSLDRVIAYAIDGVNQATMTYDNFSRVTGIVYSQAKDALGNTLKLNLVKHDGMQRVTGSTYQTSDGKVFDESVVLSQLGKTVGASQTYNGQTINSSFSFDKLGRLTSATVGQTKFDYGFNVRDLACSTLPGLNENANKDSNRTNSAITNLLTNTQQSSNWYCYDMADRLIKSSDVQIGAPTYDDHGNTASFAGGGVPIKFTYNASDQNTMISQGTNRIEYTKTASGAIVRKKEYLKGVLNKSYRYVAGGRILQSCSLTNASSCTNLDTYISLPGAVTLTKSPTNTVITKRIIYSLKNFHGDTALTINASGVATSSLMADGPFGEGLIAGTLGAFTTGTTNSSNQFMGWAANPARKQETMFTLGIVQMGQRVYIPSLGRFLQADPVEGGTSNAYVYVQDPINFDDYNGMWGVPTWARWVAGAVAAVAIVAIAIIVLPIIAGAVALTAGIAIGVAALGAIAATGISIAARGKIDGTTAIHAVIGATSGLLLAAGSALAGSIMAASSAATTLIDDVAQKVTPYMDKSRNMINTGGFNLTRVYYDRLMDQGRSNFVDLANRIIENGEITGPDPRGHDGFYKYILETGGNKMLEMIYNPVTLEISHISYK